MKKNFLTIVLVLGFFMSLNAQTNQNEVSVEQSTESATQITNPCSSQNDISINLDEEISNITSQSNESEMPFSDQEKSPLRRRIETWQYIVGGAIIATFIVIAIIAPESISFNAGI